jgi:phosphatidylserine/phosphatidylglycerophosphate/cardiolipin synthase-like enzyme
MLPRALLLITIVMAALAGWWWHSMSLATPRGRQPVAPAVGTRAEQLPERDGGTNQPAELWADEDYLPAVLALLAGAHGSIDVTMFSCVLPESPRATHPVRRILDALIARQRDGVAVRVVLDRGMPPGRQAEGEDAPSDRAAQYLAQAGIAVRWDEEQRTTHTKSLVVDGRWCVVGSTNWSASALSHNREQSVRLDDRALAAEITARFNAAWAVARPVR